jgi:type II secretory pathway component PulM
MERLRRWWTDAAPRQHALAALGALLVAGAPVALLVAVPLQRDLASTEAALVDARAAVAEARRQAAEIGTARAGALLAAGDARAAVERILVQRGVRSLVTALQGKDGRIEVTFEAIDFATLTALVEALAREARVFPVEALVAARTTPGSVRAEIAFARAAP